MSPLPGGDSHGGPALLHPLLRFMVAAVWAVAVFWGSGFVFLLFPEHILFPAMLFRIAVFVLTLAGFAFFIRVLDLNPAPLAPALGLPINSSAVRQFVAGLVLGAFLITIAVVVIAGFGTMQLHFHHGRMVWLRALMITVLLLFGAAGEELAFRGYPFQKLTQSFGALGALLVLSTLFGAVHLRNPDAPRMLSWGFCNTLLVGALFALARIRTGSLWFSIGMHFGWNFFQGAVFGLAVSGLHEFASFATATVHGSSALTGGAYGLEASATCTIVLVLGTPLLWWMSSALSLPHRAALPESDGN